VARVAWTLTDNSTATPVTYSFEVNPKQFELPGRTSKLTQSATTAPNGQTIVSQGVDEVARGSFTGSIRTEAQFNNVRTWVDKWYPLTLTDDQGSPWEVIVQNYKLQRVKTANNQWRYEYTLEFLSL
jgi:hypothetical protein